jgi:hypothetical protein
MPGEKPDLPSDMEWPDATLGWFKAWQKSFRTDGWDEAQWAYMFDTALVHALVWGDSNFTMLGELRQRLSYLGLSFDQKKETIVYVDEKKVTPLEEFRKRREERKTPPRRSGTKN